MRKILIILSIISGMTLSGCQNYNEYTRKTEEFIVYGSKNSNEIHVMNDEHTFLVKDPDLYIYCKNKIGDKIKLTFDINYDEDVKNIKIDK